MENIVKQFSGVRALNNVSITVNEGEIVALVGENGAGKSTLMKVLSGVYKYGEYEGKIIIDENEQKFLAPAGAEKAGVEMIYQELNPFLDLSIAENIFMGIFPEKGMGIIDWAKMYSSSEELLAKIDFKFDVRRSLRNLGASQQQLVAIARALARNASILVLDEPTSSLTAGELEKLFELLNLLKSEGKSIIYISHRLDEIFKIADRIYVLRDGNNVGEFATNETTSDVIVRTMIGRDIKDMYPQNQAVKGEVVLKVKDMTILHPYANKELVNGISFNVRKGEIVGIAGLVGSGRSEILNSIFGSYKGLYSAEVFIDSKKVSIKSPLDARVVGIALLTEDRRKNGIIGIMGVDANITLPTLKKITKNFIINKFEEKKVANKFVQDLRIKTPTVKTLVSNLSGGNQQKVVISKWLNTVPKVLLMDEPTRGIDVGAKVEIYQLMNKLTEQGIAIIWVSSEIPELLAISDRILVLRDGAIKGEFTRDEATQETVMMIATGSNKVAS
jgi:D-xylose transport system ATP-binding protein